ncbi:MAG: hypothetical protein JNM07_00540 [Phycisphaerae bacterium]|nr:hypothetical protein [Phycisphaerae bacterium]
MVRVALVSLFLGACSCLPAFAATEPPKPEAPKAMNAKCPITNEDVDPGTPTVVYKNVTVGFCCPGCDKKFLAMEAKEKDAFVAKLATFDARPKVAPPADAKSGAINGMCPISKEPIEDAKIASVVNGSKVAFCCEKCKTKFDKMAEGERVKIVTTLLEAKAKSDAAAKATGVAHSTLMGELVELGCFLDKGAKGADHAACAESCAQRGAPLALLVKAEPGKGEQLVLVIAKGKKSLADAAKGNFGKPVSLTGQLVNKHGLSAIVIDTDNAVQAITCEDDAAAKKNH